MSDDVIGKLTVYGEAHYAYSHPVHGENENPTRHRDLKPGALLLIETREGTIQVQINHISMVEE